jgi:aminobenzoyl-glutamate utilization protein B
MRVLSYLVVATALTATRIASGAQEAKPVVTKQAPPGLSSVMSSEQVDRAKRDVVADIDRMRTMTQQMVDQVFSFGELGYQEFETSKYLSGILQQNGFTIQSNVADIPTAWTATWGSGKPIIALGSDIDDIPQASQKPGVAYHDPLIAGAPGHGEGHNSGLPLQITAALAVKKIMERERLSGTLLVWPGVAEELNGGKAYLVRAGVFKSVDVCLFAHVGNTLSVRWGEASNTTGLVSIEYSFKGESAHAAGSPWRGRSALDAVELMNVGWNYRREHLRPQQRSHYVVTNGGDQPNVVPQNASVWYFLREIDYPHIKEMCQIADQIAKGATLMTNTEVVSRVLGAAWPQHFNKIVAETMYSNIKAVGLPAWDDADLTLAKAIQKELGQPQQGLNTEIGPLQGPARPEDNRGGPSDDIGDVSWNVPTVTLGYPSNIPALPGHNWANTIASATPIAHKGATAGAKVVAMTAVDLLAHPVLIQQAWDYFRNVQTKDQKYEPLIAPTDRPVTSLNAKTMEQYRTEMKKYYYDPTKYKTYLEQLGIKYPTVRPEGNPAK